MSLPSGVITFLLTDIEGSTRRWEADSAAMADALARHDALVGLAVDGNGGVLLKTKGEGDSTFSVFARTSDAAAAAIALRRALATEPWPGGDPIRVRAAIHMGEAVERDGDYFGPAVNRVARLRALAAGGEILVSQSAAHLLLDHASGDWNLEDLGERVLKDLARPEQVFALLDEPVDRDRGHGAGAIGPLPLTPSLAREEPCLGRDEEFTRLATLWDKAGDGERLAVLLAGEPGVGKTAIAASFARHVHGRGGLVVHGRCDEDLGGSYQPFVEALRALLPAVPTTRLRGLGHHAAQLMRLLPEIGERLPGLPLVARADAEAERLTLFEGVSALLCEVSRDQPVLLVLDDLHWADKPTLLMLRHLMRTDDTLRLLVVGTYRDTEVDRSHAFTEVLADLRRTVTVERLTLGGLDLRFVEEMVAAAAGHELDGPGLGLAFALHRETGGNPFFLGEVLRHLAESGAVYQDARGRWTSDLRVEELGLPEGVRDVVGRRLTRLSAAANTALSTAAVIGSEFELRMLEAIPEAGAPQDLLPALEEAVDAGLLTEDRGRFAFSHALVRQTLLGELRSTRRVRLHRRIGEAIESMPDAAGRVDALAFHFAEAAADGQSTKAADYALAAARASIARSAHEEAIAQLEKGLESLELAPPVDLGRRCDLVLELAEVHRWLSSRTSPEVKRLVDRAAVDARHLGSASRLARAAMCGLYPSVGTPDPDGVALVEEALAVVPVDDHLTRAQLLALLAVHRRESEGRTEEADRLAEEALGLAQLDEQDSPDGMVRTLMAMRVLTYAWRWGVVGAVDQVADAVLAVPVEYRTAEQVSIAHQARVIQAFHAGDLGELLEEMDCVDRLAAETRGWEPTYISLAFRTTRALMDGRWSDADGLCARLLAHAGEEPNALNVWAGDQILLGRDTGRHEELLPLVVAAAEANPGIPGFRAGWAILEADLGHLDRARQVLAPLAADGFVTVPRDQTFPITIAVMTETAALLGESGWCEPLHELLAHEAGRPATVNGTLYVGAADRFRGMAAAVLGDLDLAEQCYLAAIEQEASLAAVSSLVRTRSWYGRLLRQRRGPGDDRRAAEVLDLALADARRLGMPLVADQIEALRRDEYPPRESNPEPAD